jgi:hypothetical protein
VQADTLPASPVFATEKKNRGIFVVFNLIKGGL